MTWTALTTSPLTSRKSEVGGPSFSLPTPVDISCTPRLAAEDRADHAEDILLTDLAQVPFRVAAPQQLGGETGEVCPGSHPGEGELTQAPAGVPGRDLLGR